MTRFSTGAALAALLCALAATARCAPSSGAAGTTSAAVTPTPVPQWHNPCGVLGKSGAARNTLRHHGKKANKLRDWLDQVKLQFTLTQRKLERLKPRINELYGHVANLESQISISWLEFKHFEWYKNNLRKLQLKEKAGGVLQRMHTSLQTMLATVVSLQQFSPHLRKRLELFAEVRTEVNKMLCESEEALLQLNMSVPERVDGSVVSWNEQDSKPDHTDLLLMDWGVLDKLVRSVKNWMRVLDDMLGTARPKNPAGERTTPTNPGRGPPESPAAGNPRSTNDRRVAWHRLRRGKNAPASPGRGRPQDSPQATRAARVSGRWPGIALRRGKNAPASPGRGRPQDSPQATRAALVSGRWPGIAYAGARMRQQAQDEGRP